MTDVLPEGVLVGFYGDDFTGSTATLEALAFAGLKTMLFFETPDAVALAQVRDCRAIGIAGLARAKSPRWMEHELPVAFKALATTKTALVHYKVCSTFDSAPQVGSIGKAIEIGAETFGNDLTPVCIAVPQLARWQAFGNLFAASSGVNYRIDRHPVMKSHPVTPMDEGDLRLHLARQTKLKAGLVDLVDLKTDGGFRKLKAESEAGAGVVFIDTVDDETLTAAGKLIWEGRGRRRFVVGSQGVEYALLSHWRKAGALGAAPEVKSFRKVERIAAVSGSVSPVTAGQISHALQNGFVGIALKTHLAVDERAWMQELKRVTDLGHAELKDGRDPLVFSARGPDDPEVGLLGDAIQRSGLAKEDVSQRIGSGLGAVLGDLVKEAKLTRAVISGGDSSGQACIAMGISGVTALAPLAMGSPLCRAYSRKAHLDGIEIVLKGGQMGTVDFFSKAKG